MFRATLLKEALNLSFRTSKAEARSFLDVSNARLRGIIRKRMSIKNFSKGVTSPDQNYPKLSKTYLRLP